MAVPRGDTRSTRALDRLRPGLVEAALRAHLSIVEVMW